MKTRVELWKEYRDDIERNISLQNSVAKSNKKLSFLISKVNKIYPKYFKKYQSNLSKFEANIESIEYAPKINAFKINSLIDEIDSIKDELFESDASFQGIDDITFSSEELLDVLMEINNSIEQKENKEATDINSSTIINMTQSKKETSKKQLTIAIDGPSGSGKSTVAKKLSIKYNLKYLNTGLLYRAIALYCIENDIDTDSKKEVVSILPTLKLKFLDNEKIELNDEVLSEELRSDLVSQNASKVASITQVRLFATKIAQDESSKSSVIMDGRDTTFKVLPNALVKIFLDTSPEVRAKRRLEQNKNLGYSTNYNSILEEIIKRDKRDRTRKVDPLHQTEGAVLIDASDLSIDEVVKKISNIIDEKI